MKSIILKILVLLLKTVYLPIQLFKVKNKIALISRESNIESIDFKKIRQEIEKKYPEYEIKVLTKKVEAKDGIIKQLLPNISNIFKQMYYLSTSKVIVLDTYCITACILPHKKDTKIVQIWHALGAIKKFGYQTIGTKNGAEEKVAKIMCMHKNYDYILAPSIETANIYKQAFNIGEDNIKYIGMPRIDYILEDDEKIKEKIYEVYPILKTKQNIIYVPTFRKGEKIYLDELVEKFDTNKYNLIIKLHPLDLKEYKYMQRDGIIYDNKMKTYDLLKIADKVITDYSSLSIEASLLNIPIYFYNYDIEKYKRETGLNFDFEKEPISKYETQDVDELLKKIDEDYDYDVLEKFRQKYVSIETKDVTNQVVDFIVRLARNEKVEDIGSEPIKEKQSI